MGGVKLHIHVICILLLNCFICFIPSTISFCLCRPIALLEASVICWLWPTWNKVYLILSCRHVIPFNIPIKYDGDFHEGLTDCKEVFIQVFNLVFYWVFTDRLSISHSALSSSKIEPAASKDTNGLSTSWPLSNILCLVAVTWYLWHHHNPILVSLVVGDGLAHIGNNLSSDVARNIRSVQCNDNSLDDVWGSSALLPA